MAGQARVAKPAHAGQAETGNDVGQVGEGEREQMNLRLSLTQFHGVENDADDEDVENDAEKSEEHADRVAKAVESRSRVIASVRIHHGKVTRRPCLDGR